MTVLSIVIPCYNEEEVIGETASRLALLMDDLLAKNSIAQGSAVFFVDDGSRDTTWKIIEELNARDPRMRGIKLSRNHGHQRALLAGLMSVPGDVTISVDADLQDDLAAIPIMLEKHREGAEIVYGVREKRETDTPFKRLTAEYFYKFLSFLGAKVIFNHADYRLLSRKAIDILRDYEEVNLFLRGLIPLLGFKTAIVSYERQARFAGESKYPFVKMVGLAFEGVTSFSTQPLRWITFLGMAVSIVSFIIGFWAIIITLFDRSAVPGWASIVVPMSFLSGLQIFSLGIIGEYVGKTYLETKRRPRFIIEKII